MYRKNLPEYFIWHTGSKFVLSRTHSLSCAHSLTEGILNTEIACHFPDELSIGGLVELKSKYLKFVDPIVTLPDSSPDEETLKLIRLAKLRTHCFLTLESRIDHYRLRFYNTHDAGFYQWVNYALTSSDVESNTFSNLIKEYASILEISDSSAYYDLKMKYDTYAIVNIKAKAFYEKFKIEINNSNNEEEMRKIIDQCSYDMYQKASI
jgi:hypothetical protein